MAAGEAEAVEVGFAEGVSFSEGDGFLLAAAGEAEAGGGGAFEAFDFPTVAFARAGGHENGENADFFLFGGGAGFDVPLVGEFFVGRRLKAVPLAEGEGRGGEVLDAEGGFGHLQIEGVLAGIDVEGFEGVGHELEGGGFGGGEVVVDDDEVGFDEEDMAEAMGETLAVGVGGVADDVIGFGGEMGFDDAAVGGGGVFDLAFAVDEDGVVGARAVGPIVMESAAMQIAVNARDQERFAVRV